MRLSNQWHPAVNLSSETASRDKTRADFGIPAADVNPYVFIKINAGPEDQTRIGHPDVFVMAYKNDEEIAAAALAWLADKAITTAKVQFVTPAAVITGYYGDETTPDPISPDALARMAERGRFPPEPPSGQDWAMSALRYAIHEGNRLMNPVGYIQQPMMVDL